MVLSDSHDDANASEVESCGADAGSDIGDPNDWDDDPEDTMMRDFTVASSPVRGAEQYRRTSSKRASPSSLESDDDETQTESTCSSNESPSKRRRYRKFPREKSLRIPKGGFANAAKEFASSNFQGVMTPSSSHESIDSASPLSVDSRPPDLLYTVHGTLEALERQSPTLPQLIPSALCHSILEMCLSDAFFYDKCHVWDTVENRNSSPLERVAYDGFLHACREHHQASLTTRMSEDHVYSSAVLSQWLIPRLESLRESLKIATSRVVAQHYHFHPGNPTCAQVAHRLICDDNYIYPWDGKAWDRQRPYRSPLIVAILRAWFFEGDFPLIRSPEFGKKIKQISRDPNHPEVPDMLVALIATLAYAAIHEWLSGSYQAVDIRSDVFGEKYNKHVQMLGARRACWWDYHAMLADIYANASNEGASGSVANLESAAGF